jgi:branched-chain amino acid aminotransferase
MTTYTIADGVKEAVRDFALPEKLGFGLVLAPIMYSVEYAEGQWGKGVLLPYGPIEIAPGARALHYGEFVFEGMKAYRAGRGRPNLFRPLDNCRRLALSAARLAMPEVPESLFLEGIDAVAGAMEERIPTGGGKSLYLRPFLYGTEPGYLLRNSSTFRFMVIANPVEAYASGPMRVAIERRDVRAAVGGVGVAKASANYAASLRASSASISRGYTIALWLDGAEHRYIQELSGMNFFAVIDGTLHTPELDGAILPGITRDSLITLARHLGYGVTERPMLIDELLSQIRLGVCTEIFACGTAAIVAPVACLGDLDGQEYAPREVDSVAATLRNALLAIQERRADDPFGWTREVSTVDA